MPMYMHVACKHVVSPERTPLSQVYCLAARFHDFTILRLLQGAFRAVLRINGFLLIHHLMFCTFVVLAYQAESIFVIKIDVILSCFATYEFLLYAALVARKVPALRGAFPSLLVAGISFYLLTRLVQLALLICLFVLSYGSMQATSRTKALYWVSMAMCIALVLLQSYTFVIYYSLWKSRPHWNKIESSGC